MGRIITCSLNTLFSVNSATKGYTIGLKPTFKKDDTYIVITSLDDYLYKHSVFIETHPNIKVIYKSDKAVNRTTGHGTDPRNTVYVLEWQE